MELYKTTDENYSNYTIRKLVSVLNSIDAQFNYEVSKLERISPDTGELVEYYLLFADRIFDAKDSIATVFYNETVLQTYLIDTLKHVNDENNM